MTGMNDDTLRQLRRGLAVIAAMALDIEYDTHNYPGVVSRETAGSDLRRDSRDDRGEWEERYDAARALLSAVTAVSVRLVSTVRDLTAHARPDGAVSIEDVLGEIWARLQVDHGLAQIHLELGGRDDEPTAT